MKLSALWSIVHDWNAHRKHRACMVCIADAHDISTEGLLLDWVNAATHGSLLTLDEAKGRGPYLDNSTSPATLRLRK